MARGVRVQEWASCAPAGRPPCHAPRPPGPRRPTPAPPTRSFASPAPQPCRAPRPRLPALSLPARLGQGAGQPGTGLAGHGRLLAAKHLGVLPGVAHPLFPCTRGPCTPLQHRTGCRPASRHAGKPDQGQGARRAPSRSGPKPHAPGFARPPSTSAPGSNSAEHSPLAQTAGTMCR